MSSAQHLIGRVDGYLEILAAHGIDCVRVESTDPGRIIYEDEDQVVTVPDPGDELHLGVVAGPEVAAISGSPCS